MNRKSIQIIQNGNINTAQLIIDGDNLVFQYNDENIIATDRIPYIALKILRKQLELVGILPGKAGYDIGVNGLGQNGFAEHSPHQYNLVAGFVAEVILTFIFLLVIFGSTSTKNIHGGFAGLSIGLSLVLIHIVGIPVTGVSVNPARSIGPAVFVGGAAISQVWMFILAPLVGAVLSAIVWRYALERE